MTKHLFTEEAGERWGWPGIDGVSLSTKADFDFLSVSTVTVTGQHEPAASSFNDRAFAVLAGFGWFEVSDQRFDVGPSNVVIVPKGTTYDFGSAEGMKVLIIDTPAYVEEGESS